MIKIPSKQLAIFNEVAAEKRKDCETLNKPEYSALWTSVIDKYPDSAHFVFELLQNADDAKATLVHIKLGLDGVTFKHNGTERFTVTSIKDALAGDRGHINSITAIGFNDKRNDPDKIGKFGVGFKAVFQYTETPHIYDTPFCFRLEEYIVPILLDNDHSWRQDGETIIYLPFNKNGRSPEKSFNDIANKVRSLKNPMLFLNNLLEIRCEIEGDDNVYLFKEEILEEGCENNVEYKYLKLHSGDKTDFIYLFNKHIEYDDVTFNICAGLYIDDSNGEILYDVRPPVYSFFPTSEKIDTPFIIHAPFELVDNRQQLQNESDLNKYIVGQVAELMADALNSIRLIGVNKKINYIDRNILKLLPNNEHRSYWDDEVLHISYFHDAIKNILVSEPMFLSESGTYIKAQDSCITNPQDIKSLFTQKQLHLLYGNKSIRFIQIDNYTEGVDLGINILTTRYLIDRLSIDFLVEQDDKWLIRLYKFFKDDARQYWNKTDKKSKNNLYILRNKPIIKLNDGTFVSIDNNNGDINIFLPSANISIGSEYNIINEEILKDSGCQMFFKELGVDVPNELDYVKSVVLLNAKKRISTDSKAAFRIFRSLLRQFIKCDRSEKEDLMQVVNKEMLFAGRCIFDNELYFVKASELLSNDPDLLRYFCGDYQEDSDNIEDYDPVYCLDMDYYQAVTDQFDQEDVNDFIQRLDIIRNPALYECDYPYNGKARFGVTQMTTWLEYSDYTLEGLKAHLVADDFTFNDSMIAAKYIDNAIATNEGCLVAMLRYQYYSVYEKYADSTFKDEIKQLKLFNREERLIATSKIFKDDIHPRYFAYENLLKVLDLPSRDSHREEIIRQNPELAQDLNLVDKLRKAGITEAELDKFIKDKKAENISKVRNDLSKIREIPESDTDISVLFNGTAPSRVPTTPKAVTPKDLEEEIKRVEEEGISKLDDLLDKKKRENELKRAASTYDRYTYGWFASLLELESGHYENIEGGKGISITFDKIHKEKDSERIYVLKNPSRYIPVEVEEIGGISIDFYFKDKDSISFGFEVANVRDYSLRLKAKASDVTRLIDCGITAATRAELNIGSSINLTAKLKNAFANLDLAPAYNLKQNLNNNISFVFGPPGTGKTTYLSNKIIDTFEANDCQRVLVLTPTNKACDVIVNKIVEQLDGEIPEWLRRFVATSEEDIEKMGLVCDRTSEIYKQDKCCLVSTIARFPYDHFAKSSRNEETDLREIDWDCIIIDEASMIPLAQIAYVIYKQRGKSIVIAGDPFQILPIVKEDSWKGENIYSMVNLNSFDSDETEPIEFDIHRLETQYRSVPSIGELFSQYTYNGMLSHSRGAYDIKPISVDGIDLKPINFIPFKVERFDSVYGAKKLSTSNVQIYSVLLAFESVKYVAEQISSSYDGLYKIGIICPYTAEAQLIERLFDQYRRPANVEISIGTIHGFQGDQCDMIFAVLNPPMGLKRSVEKVFLNNKNILNVAISRARDYLFVLLPNNQTDGWNNLYEINALGDLAAKKLNSFSQQIPSYAIEKIIFDNGFYIEENTFVTTHQMANVYSQDSCKYEVRIDANSVDILISE